MEDAAAVNRGQGHDVEEPHAESADQHRLPLGDVPVVLLHRVARADPDELGVLLDGLRQGLLLGVGGRSLPTDGQDGGIGGDHAGIRECDHIAVTVLADGHRAGVVLLHLHPVRQQGECNIESPPQVGAVEGPRGVGLRDGLVDLLTEILGDLRCRWVGAEEVDGLFRDVGEGVIGITAQQADPVVLGGALHHRRGDGGSGFGEQGDRTGQGVHAQGPGLVGAPDVAGAHLGVLDEVEDKAALGVFLRGGCGELGGDPLDDGDAPRADTDDRDLCRGRVRGLVHGKLLLRKK